MAQEAEVIAMPSRDCSGEQVTPWGALGFETERDMLIHDLRVLSERINSPSTTATALAALSKRKQEILEQIKAIDAGDDEDDILDDSEDEELNVGGE